MGVRRRILAAVLGGAVLLAGPLSLPASGLEVIRARARLWDPNDPESATAAKNERIAWRNNSGVDHNLKSYGGNWPKKKRKNVPLEDGEATSVRIKRNGTYKFLCTIHGGLVDGVCITDGMCGRVIVG